MPDQDPTVTIRWRRCVVAALASFVVGCLFPSEEEVQRRFREYVNGANSCAQASECAVASAGCPLGCSVAVRADRKADVEKRARELIAEYERGGRGCEYDCVPNGPLACTNGRCDFLPFGGTDAGAAGSGGPPLPPARATFEPVDVSTNVGSGPLSIVFFDAAGHARSDDFVARARIVTWPERAPVAASVSTVPGPGAPSPSFSLRIAPTETLADRWYRLELAPGSPPVDSPSPMEAGAPGARFRPGSAPRMRTFSFCEKAPPGIKLLASTSELVVAARSAAEVISLSEGGRPIRCELYQTIDREFLFACDVTPAIATIRVAEGLVTPTGLPIAPATWTVDLSTLPAGSCRNFAVPL
jgi:hypothetical protein